MSTQQAIELPKKYQLHWEKHRVAVHSRLQEFRAVPPEEYFYELLYCLLTPQSKAANAEQVIKKLRALDFLHTGIDPTPLLRDPAHYIRFHNVKATRARSLRNEWEDIQTTLLSTEIDGATKRDLLVVRVNGLGWKEASHFLRNIGYLELAIIDRHILKHLLECRAIDSIPKTLTQRSYKEIEERFHQLATSFGLTLQELDLLFWSFEEGSVRK